MRASLNDWTLTHIMAIERAGSGGRIGRLMRAALRHPFGITLLIASLALAVAVRVVPSLEVWSSRAPLIALIGILSYAASVFAVRHTRPQESSLELRKLQSIRDQIEAQLRKLRSSEKSDGRTELARILSEAIVQLDRQVTPALRQLLERQRVLSKYLSDIGSGKLPSPGQDVLERLRGINARQRAAIEECVQQAANAAGTLVALLQESDDTSIASQARTWAKDLLTLYDAIADVLRGDDEDEDAPAPEYPRGADAERPNVPGEIGPLVQEALRRLNQPAQLSQCALIDRLPHTLAATSAGLGDELTSDSTPLRQAQILREVLNSAIQRLRPATGDIRPGSPEALQYSILHEAYVRGTSTASIMARHSIAESTFHRHRRDAVQAVARDLTRREELLRQDTRAR